MRLIIFLFCLPILAQTTQIHDLRLASLSTTSKAGEVRVQW